jgi:histone H3/H4
MNKFDITRFTDAALKQAGRVYMTGEDMKTMQKKRKTEEEKFQFLKKLKQAGRVYMTGEDMKTMQKKRKTEEEKFQFLKKQGDAEMRSQALNDAMEFHKMQHPEKYAKPERVEEKGRADVLAKLDAIYSKDPATWTPAEKSYVQNMAPYITRRKTDVTGMPSGGGKGAKTQSLADIQKTYRKDFIHEEAQKWFSDVSKAVESNDWDTFMALGKDIQGLETRISQGIAGTSEVVRSQISSATAFWSTISEQLTPELYKTPGARTEPPVTGGAGVGIGAQVPEGLEAEVYAAQDLFDAGQTEEATTKLNELIKAHGKDVIDELMR